LVLFLLATKIILREYPPESTAVHKFTIPKKRMLTPKIEQIETRSHLKNRILVQVPPLKLSGIKRRGRGSTRPVVNGIFDTHTSSIPRS